MFQGPRMYSTSQRPLSRPYPWLLARPKYIKGKTQALLLCIQHTKKNVRKKLCDARRAQRRTSGVRVRARMSVTKAIKDRGTKKGRKRFPRVRVK